MQSTHPENLRFSAVEIDADWVDEMEVLQASVKLFIEKANTMNAWKKQEASTVQSER